MKKLAVVSMVALLAASCDAQEHKNSDLAQNNDRTLKQEPKGTWKVDKEVDENGNIIKYDSIYSWSSQNNRHILTPEQMDSIMGDFRAAFGERFGDFNGEDFSGFFNRDSLFTKEFFGEDFMNGDFGMDFSNFEDLREHMETMRQHFMDKQPLIPAEPEKGDTEDK